MLIKDLAYIWVAIYISTIFLINGFDKNRKDTGKEGENVNRMFSSEMLYVRASVRLVNYLWLNDDIALFVLYNHN